MSDTMDKPCSHTELTSRVVGLEYGLAAFRQVLDERDERYKLRAATQDQAVKAALETSDKALNKAETATEKRFDSVNEFRKTLADQAALLMPRAEYSVQHVALEEKVAVNGNRINMMQQDISSMMARGGGIKDAWGYLVGAAGILFAMLSVYLRH